VAAPQVTTLSGREAEIHISKDDLSGKSFGAFATQPPGVAFKVLPEIDDLKPGHIRYTIKVMVADTTGRQLNDHTQAASSTAQELVATCSAEENVPVLFELGSVGKERKRTAVFIFRSLPPQETAIPPAQTAQLLSFGLVIERLIEPANPEWRALNLALSNFVTPAPGRKLDFSQVHLMAKTIPPKHLSDFRNPGLLGKMNFRLGLNSWKLPWRLNCCRTRRTRNGCVANTMWR